MPTALELRICNIDSFRSSSGFTYIYFNFIRCFDCYVWTSHHVLFQQFLLIILSPFICSSVDVAAPNPYHLGASHWWFLFARIFEFLYSSLRLFVTAAPFIFLAIFWVHLLLSWVAAFLTLYSFFNNPLVFLLYLVILVDFIQSPLHITPLFIQFPCTMAYPILG